VGALSAFLPPLFVSPHVVIEPSALRAAKAYSFEAIPRFIQMNMPLLLLKLMAQSRRGVTHLLEAKAHPPTKAIPRFIQMNLPLLLLKLMAQSQCGVTHFLEAQAHPPTKA
jgi:predicted benzoate:H+ symporter BenE